MSSFLQCSIELLNSYNFVKQKKCKRGLLKSKGSHPCLDCVFHPNLWSNLYPPPGPNPPASSSKGPNSSRCCPVCCAPFYDSGSAVLARSSWGQRFPAPAASPWAAAPLPRSQQQHCPGWRHCPAQRSALPSQSTSLCPGTEHKTHPGLLQEEK